MVRVFSSSLLSLFFILSFPMDAHFLPLGTPKASKSPVNNTYIPPSPASPPHPTRSLPTSRMELSSELRPLDPTISENDKDDSPPKLGEDRMLPKMHKRWMHHELDREVVIQLEKPLRVMGLGIRPEKSSGDRSFGYFFLLHDLRFGTHANCCGCR